MRGLGTSSEGIANQSTGLETTPVGCFRTTDLLPVVRIDMGIKMQMDGNLEVMSEALGRAS
jgi:hypothetical protein